MHAAPAAGRHNNIIINRKKKFQTSDGKFLLTYPVMAGEHEVIGPETPIPEPILAPDDIDVVDDGSFQGSNIVRIRLVEEFDHSHDTEREKEHLSSLRIPCP